MHTPPAGEYEPKGTWRDVVFETIYDGVIVSDAEGRILDWNAGAERIYGWARDEVLGRRADFLQADRGDAVVREILDVVLKGGTWSGEIAFTAKDGSTGYTETIVVPLRDATDTIIGSIGVNRDATSRRQAERSLEQKREELRQVQRTEALGRLTAGIAHDFNGLLTIIGAQAELLLERALDAGARDDVIEIQHAVDRATRLVRKLLTVPGRKAGAGPADLCEAVRSVDRLMRRTLPDGVRLMLDVPPEPALVPLDETALQQILLNLAVNAREAIVSRSADPDRSGGAIRVAVDRPDPSTARLVVEDDGCGMSDDVQRRALEPFFSTRAGRGGTGLGLPTVHGMVAEAGGELRIASEVDRGTRVIVTLPAVPPDAAGRA